MRAHGCVCYTWRTALTWNAGTFRDAEGSWWHKLQSGDFARVYYCPYCGNPLAYDPDTGLGELDDWTPAHDAIPENQPAPKPPRYIDPTTRT